MTLFVKYSFEPDNLLEPRQDQTILIKTFEVQVENKTDDLKNQWLHHDDVKPPDKGNTI